MSHGINRLLRRFFRSRRGNIAIITAIALPVVIGFCGFATETAYWFYRNRDIQGAADVAAFGAAVVLRQGGTSSQILAAATADAVTNGWRQTGGTITVNRPPTSGAYQNTNTVEVILTEQEDRYFTKIYFGNTKVTVSSRGIVTHYPGGPACFLGLDKTKSGTVEFWGNSTADFTACNIASNSVASDSFKVGGSANVAVPCVSSSGGSQTDTGLHLTSCGSVATGQDPTPDPYKDVAPPTWSSCSNAPSSPTSLGTDGQVTCYNGASLGTINTNIQLHGIVVINGGSIRINSGSGAMTGTNTMLYFTNNATFDFNGSAHLDITASTTGPYAGLAMFGDRNNAFATQKLNGNSTSKITGAVYFPTMELDFQGNWTGNNGCMQLVADVIYYTGNGTFTNDCSGTGIKPALVPGQLALVE